MVSRGVNAPGLPDPTARAAASSPISTVGVGRPACAQAERGAPASSVTTNDVAMKRFQFMTALLGGSSWNARKSREPAHAARKAIARDWTGPAGGPTIAGLSSRLAHVDCCHRPDSLPELRLAT